ncbi:hypothetical protein NA78x_000847 [Anatilimnocola sp. NA78]|uniref:hypothetical protein n=1 Tax=Anatilimnocola sp. NA78 TaxID=3415683 RepID=UPI003CE536DE
MLTTLMLMSLVMMVSVGNLALGYGLAVHLGHGPAAGWQALLFWKKGHTVAAATDGHAAPAPAAVHAAPAKTHH